MYGPTSIQQINMYWCLGIYIVSVSCINLLTYMLHLLYNNPFTAYVDEHTKTFNPKSWSESDTRQISLNAVNILDLVLTLLWITKKICSTWEIKEMQYYNTTKTLLYDKELLWTFRQNNSCIHNRFKINKMNSWRFRWRICASVFLLESNRKLV